MVKITDVAKEAGVSTSTVSRVLRKDKSFSASDGTVHSVLDAVEKLGYTPLRKRTNKQPKQNTKFQIAIALTVSKEGEQRDPYWTAIRIGVEEQAARTKMTIKKLIRIDETASPKDFDDVDGVILIGTVNPKTISDVGLTEDKTVLVNNASVDTNGYDKVSCDLYHATVRNIERLRELGHTDIGFIGGIEEVKDIKNQENVEIDDTRLKAYKEYLISKNIYNNLIEHTCDWSTTGGYEVMKQIIADDNVQTAYIMASDPISMGAMRALREHGIRVPRDVSIISFDDIDAAAFLTPPLSSVNMFTEEIGIQAVNLLSQRLKGRKVAINSVIQPKLKQRESFAEKNSNR